MLQYMKTQVYNLVILAQTPDLLALKVYYPGIMIDMFLTFCEEQLAGLNAISPQNVGMKIKNG
jgi:hypothetical protein